MRVLYLVLGMPTGGVRNKVLDKAEFLRRSAGEVTVLIVCGNKDAFEADANHELLRVDHGFAVTVSRLWYFWRIAVILEQWRIYAALTKYLDKREDFDVILMRYPVADYFLFRFVRKFKHRTKIVFEHNTLEDQELKLRSVNSFWYKYFLRGEQRFGKEVRHAVAGMVGVTDEIATYQKELAAGATPVISISNGIDLSRVKMKSPVQKPHETTNLLLLAGSQAPWHGVDILLNSLANYSGPFSVHCYIAGDVDASLKGQAMAMPNVTLLEHQAHADLDRLIEKCHVGIGSLALFRNSMKEACTLKVREYWARGLPFVVGYEDTDLKDNVRMQPFYLKLNVQRNQDRPEFDLALIVSFAQQVCGIPDYPEKMRALAEEYIGYPVKAGAYVNFFKTLSR